MRRLDHSRRRRFHRLLVITSTGFALIGPALAIDDDPRDVAFILPRLNEALEFERSGRDIAWSNPATGRVGVIRVERTFYRGQQPCRDYTRTSSGAGTAYEVRGVGCRVGRANWQVEETRISNPASKADVPSATPTTAPSGSSGDPLPTAQPANARTPDPTPSTDTAPARLAPKPPPLRYSMPVKSQP